MKRAFFTWIKQGAIFSGVVLVVFLVLSLLDVEVGTIALWISGTVIYWVLTGIVMLPWNVYFAADDVLETIRTTHEKGGVVPERDIAFAQRARRRSGLLAIAVHLITAAVFFGLAFFLDMGALYYFASGAALVLTLFRPAIRAVEHILARLETIQHTSRFPKDDVYALKERVALMERYDARATELEKAFEAKVTKLTKTYKAQADAHYLRMDTMANTVEAQERALAQMQFAIVDKIDSFDDAVAFRTAWERIVPELSRIFHPK